MTSVIIESVGFSDVNEFDKGGTRMIQNKSVKGQKKGSVCYSFEPYAQELFDLYEGQIFSKNTKKDLEKGDIIDIKDIIEIKDNVLIVQIDGGINVDIPLSKEKKFIKLFGYDTIDEFVEALKDPVNVQSLLDHDLQAYILEAEPSFKASLWHSYIKKIQNEFFNEIAEPSKAYIANVIEANKGGYFVEIQGVEAFMPGSLSAANKLTNFKDLIGEEVIVMIEDFIKDMNSFIVSHKKYIEYILPKKIQELDLTAKYEGTITGTSKFGIFVEFDKIFTGLLHVSKMDEETLLDFKARNFSPGDDISFYISEIAKDNRIILTMEDPIDKKNKLNEFIEKNKEGTLTSTVAAIMNFGIIVNVEDQSGLIPNKEFKSKNISIKDIKVKDTIDVIFGDFKDGKITFKLD